jgi:hypothetical protein
MLDEFSLRIEVPDLSTRAIRYNDPSVTQTCGKRNTGELIRSFSLQHPNSYLGCWIGNILWQGSGNRNLHYALVDLQARLITTATVKDHENHRNNRTASPADQIDHVRLEQKYPWKLRRLACRSLGKNVG